jgi:hypothetical protein
MPRSKLGIAEEALDKVTDSDAPSVLFCFDCPTKLALREAVLRVQQDTAAALGVERLWSLSRTALRDNRKSMHSSRLMQLVKLKQNMHLFEDVNFLSSLSIIDLLSAGNFDDLLSDMVAFEEEEMLARTNALPVAAALGSDAEVEPEGEAPEVEIDWDPWGQSN